MSVIRPIYSMALYLAVPFAMAYLLKRSVKQPEYKLHWAERFGVAKYPKPRGDRVFIWIHGVSVGETKASEALVELILKRWANVDILYTHMTPTGRETGRKIAKKYGSRVFQCYLPYDMPFAVKRFLAAANPAVCVLMETEVWPNLVHFAKRAGIPLVLANARLSKKSLNKGKKVSSIIREAMGCLDVTLAQSEADAERLRQAGCRNVEVCGNLKFDFTPNLPQLRTGQELRRLAGRQIVSLASTRDGEEEKFLELIEKWEGDPEKPKVLWLIIPRHPQRFDDVRKLIEKKKLTFELRSSVRNWKETLSPAGPQVVLGNSMGEMTFYYALSDISIMGGSFGNYGSQSIIEPCAIGTPLIVGPSIFNFETVIEEAEKDNALVRVEGEEQAFETLLELINDESRKNSIANNAVLFSEEKRGATEKTFNQINNLLSKKYNVEKLS